MRILDPRFRYVRSEHTTPDRLRNIFRREIKRLEDAKKITNVKPIKKVK